MSCESTAEEELKERERFLDQQQQQPDLTQLQQQLEQQEQQLGPDLLPNPLQAVEHIANAYSAEQGFREMSVEELSVALTAGGLVDLLLDVRSAEEFASGALVCLAQEAGIRNAACSTGQAACCNSKLPAQLLHIAMSNTCQ